MCAFSEKEGVGFNKGVESLNQNDQEVTLIFHMMSSAGEISKVPAELFSKFQISLYADLVDALYKALVRSFK